ncbi:hypothetical protein V2A60_004962 [Cordyceps javanica]|uniref:Mss4-like protein n=1 Tax=Cordyceps javanica TaxID=43265 RepID=A0A545VCN3_9HYPO|nr:Mss4-like protein [Cordyceps javanica]TQW10834.1 Mss4-like protein [Cordyceps javanica]
MSSLRPLRGGCQCGRNRYLIDVPEGAADEAQVLFNTKATHQASLATPLAAYIRVPLTWYKSATYAYYDDETHSTIRRSYAHPGEEDCLRYFCGYCGTQLSYWSESPASEAEYIHLTLGSLIHEDLHDLQSLGLISDDTDSDEPTQDEDIEEVAADDQLESAGPKAAVLRESFGVPWFDELVDGTKLGKFRRAHGGHRSQDGRVQVEWEIVEYSDNGDDAEDTDMLTPSSGKRKLDERGDV